LSAVEVQPPIATHSNALKLKASSDSATQTSWSDDGLFKIPQVCSHEDTHAVLGNGTGRDTALYEINQNYFSVSVTCPYNILIFL